VRGSEVQRTDAAIRVSPNQGGKKIRVHYRGFLGQNTKITGVYRPKFSQYWGFIGQNTQTPGGSSKINPWIFSAQSEETPVLATNPDKSSVLRKFR